MSSDVPDSAKQLGLAELFTALRIEIDKAIVNLEQSGNEAMFALKEAEVEIQFVISKEGKDSFSVGIPKLFAVEMGDTAKSENLHKLKVTLVPISPAPVVIAGTNTGE